MQMLRRGGKGEEMDILAHLSSEGLTHLLRLQQDFGLSILKSSQGQIALYCETGDNQLRVLTPEHESLALLEAHVEENMVDILHAYLFEETVTQASVA